MRQVQFLCAHPQPLVLHPAVVFFFGAHSFLVRRRKNPFSRPKSRPRGPVPPNHQRFPVLCRYHSCGPLDHFLQTVRPPARLASRPCGSFFPPSGCEGGTGDLPADISAAVCSDTPSRLPRRGLFTPPSIIFPLLDIPPVLFGYYTVVTGAPGLNRIKPHNWGVGGRPVPPGPT